MKIQLTTQEAEAHLQDYFDGKLNASGTVVKIGDEEVMKIKLIQKARKTAKGGHKIEAIKHFRSVTEEGLAESKSIVEKIMANDNDRDFINKFEVINTHLI